tara:strand:+ start:1371 stop:2054 length:684 start_codon:yes stop_codon:yes gene_type:complete
MAQRLSMQASLREGTGKGTARALRREGLVPAVIYGDNKAPVTITLEQRDLRREYYKGHLFTTLTELEIDGDKHLVLARDAQVHPLKDNVEHVDFLRVTKKTKIPVYVPVKFINEAAAPGLANGILNVTRYEVEVYCSALSIPEEIELDLTGADIGDVIKSSNMTLPEGVTFTIDREFTVATIVEPKAPVADDEEEAAAEGEDGAESEASESEEGEGSSEGGDEKAGE